MTIGRKCCCSRKSMDVTTVSVRIHAFRRLSKESEASADLFRAAISFFERPILNSPYEYPMRY